MNLEYKISARNLMFTDVRCGCKGEVQARYPSRGTGKIGCNCSYGYWLRASGIRKNGRSATGIALNAPVGCGFRGGNWNNSNTNARVSNRNNAANTNSNRNNNYGGRCARTSSVDLPDDTLKIEKVRL